MLRFKRTLWAHYIRYFNSNYILVNIRMPQNGCQNLNVVRGKIKPQSKIKHNLSFSEMHVKRPLFQSFLWCLGIRHFQNFRYLWYFWMDFDEILNEHSRLGIWEIVLPSSYHCHMFISLNLVCLECKEGLTYQMNHFYELQC